jgi:hypothetical protein
MGWEIVAAVVLLVVLPVGEFIAWEMGWLWHKTEPKNDPRNMRPPF